MACLGGRFWLEYLIRCTCSRIQMNGNDGLYLRLLEPLGPPDLTTNLPAKRNKDNFFLFSSCCIYKYQVKSSNDCSVYVP